MNDPLMDVRARRLGQLRLRDLRLLDAIDAHGTLQGVARALFVTQPAVSQALRSLEDAVGVALASRSRRGVVLTDAGRTLRVHLQAALASLAAGLSRLDAAPPRPVLRLGTIPYALIDPVPAALARLGAAPFDLRIVTGAVDALLHALLQGEVDAVLTRRTSRCRMARWLSVRSMAAICPRFTASASCWSRASASASRASAIANCWPAATQSQ